MDQNEARQIFAKIEELERNAKNNTFQAFFGYSVVIIQAFSVVMAAAIIAEARFSAVVFSLFTGLIAVALYCFPTARGFYQTGEKNRAEANKLREQLAGTADAVPDQPHS